MKTMTRKQFLGAAGAGTVLLWLQACGGGGDSGSDNGGLPPSISSCSSTGAAISGNHGHSVTIDKADLESTTPKTYSIQGSASHDHSITLSPANLAALKAGQSVTVTSSNNFQHDHSVMVTCA